MAKRKAPPVDTRTRILAAAAQEFGARGFAATTVDRIARRARVNKAMIYYHFHDKHALYTTIVRDLFGRIGEQLQAIIRVPAAPEDKLDRIIEALVGHIDNSASFLPIFLREIADGAVHLGRDELGLIAQVFGAVTGVIAEGVQQKVFRPVHPALAHFTLIGPLVMFRASAPVRARIKLLRRIDIPDAGSVEVVEHLQQAMRGMLRPEA